MNPKYKTQNGEEAEVLNFDAENSIVYIRFSDGSQKWCSKNELVNFEMGSEVTETNTQSEQISEPIDISIFGEPEIIEDQAIPEPASEPIKKKRTYKKRDK